MAKTLMSREIECQPILNRATVEEMDLVCGGRKAKVGRAREISKRT